MLRKSRSIPAPSTIAATMAMALLLSTGGVAQTLEQLRQSLRDASRASRYPLFMATLLNLADDGLLAGGKLHIDGSPGTALSLLSLPVRKDLELFGPSLPIRFEATVGLARARIDVPDLWNGALPGLETRAVARYRALGADVGFGPSISITPQLSIEPLLHGGVAWVDNDTDYSGPGADVTRSIADGILFNWSGVYGTFGSSLALRQTDGHLGSVEFSSLLRYDWRCTGSIAADDPSLESQDSVQWMTARIDFEGPTPWTIGAPLDWLSHLGYRRLFGAGRDVLEYEDYLEIGAGLRANTGDGLPVVSGIELSASFIYGSDIIGWTAGLSLSF